MQKKLNLFIGVSLVLVLTGCATTASDLVGGSAGLAASGSIDGPELLEAGNPTRLLLNVSAGGGRYAGTLPRLRYDFKLNPDRDLGLSAGFFQDDKISSGRGALLGAVYKMGLADTAKGFHGLTMAPEYAFMFTNYPQGYPIYEQGEFINLYNSFLNQLGCDFIVGFKIWIIQLDAHVGPYFGLYSLHAAEDETLAYFAWKYAVRLAFDIKQVELGLALNLLVGETSESRIFVDEILNLGISYTF